MIASSTESTTLMTAFKGTPKQFVLAKHHAGTHSTLTELSNSCSGEKRAKVHVYTATCDFAMRPTSRQTIKIGVTTLAAKIKLQHSLHWSSWQLSPRCQLDQSLWFEFRGISNKSGSVSDDGLSVLRFRLAIKMR